LTTRTAIVHDYLTQRGGAERVVLSMLRAFPGAPLYTSLYQPDTTFPEFMDAGVRALPWNRVRMLRQHHRLALPILAPSFSRLLVQAETVVCSSSGWAHGARVEGRKVVYCHTPARWLYQTERYLGSRHVMARSALRIMRPWLSRWDRRAAESADRYLAPSTAVRRRIAAIYGIEAEVLPPPPSLDPRAPQSSSNGLEPGFFLCVARLQPHKNVAAVAAAFEQLPRQQLVIAGTGSEAGRIRALAPPNVTLLGAVADPELRWLYAHCAGAISASYEDFGLTPLEAASFGRPAAVLRFGGFLDTTAEGESGVFFDNPHPTSIARAIGDLLQGSFNEDALRRHAARYSESAFISRLRKVVEESKV
jgi:glycosyltransferase involved in cell wall biosynthesis